MKGFLIFSLLFGSVARANFATNGMMTPDPDAESITCVDSHDQDVTFQLDFSDPKDQAIFDVFESAWGAAEDSPTAVLDEAQLCRDLARIVPLRD